MPDSQQPPFWGPAYHEWDLDALLSGAAGNTPPALRPVESTLAALRAAPTRRELSAEAAARAAFRAMAAAPVQWAAPAEHGTVTQDTLVLSPAEHLLSRADRRPPRAARHRRRRPSWDGRRSAIALTSVGVVAVTVIAVAVTGAIPGSIGQMVSFGAHPTSTASPTAHSERAGSSLDGTGRASRPTPSAEASSTPSVSPSATTAPSTLCREFYESFGRPDRVALPALFKELTQLAGGRDQVGGYCFPYLRSWAKGQGTYPTPAAGGYPGGPGSAGGYLGGPGDRGRGFPGGGGDSGVGNPASGPPAGG